MQLENLLIWKRILIMNDEIDKKEETQKQCENCEEFKRGWQRALADYQNLQKETQKKMKEWHNGALVMTVAAILPVYENMKKALAYAPESQKDALGDESAAQKAETMAQNWENWRKGCEIIIKQFAEAFDRLGVKEIQAEGAEFDPHFHEAVGEEEAGGENGGERSGNKVLKVVEPGFQIDGIVIKPAKVIISKSK